jgi:hypothetical protein
MVACIVPPPSVVKVTAQICISAFADVAPANIGHENKNGDEFLRHCSNSLVGPLNGGTNENKKVSPAFAGQKKAETTSAEVINFRGLESADEKLIKQARNRFLPL